MDRFEAASAAVVLGTLSFDYDSAMCHSAMANLLTTAVANKRHGPRHYRTGTLGPLAGRVDCRQCRRYQVRARLYPHAGEREFVATSASRSPTATSRFCAIRTSTPSCWRRRAAAPGASARGCGRHANISSSRSRSRSTSPAPASPSSTSRARPASCSPSGWPGVFIRASRRYAPGWRGRLYGNVIAMVAQHTTSTAQFVALDNWRAAPGGAPGGALTAVGVHALDHMIEFAGRVRDVRCVTARNYTGRSDDTTTIMLRFAERHHRTALLFGGEGSELRIRVTALTASPRFRGPTSAPALSRRWPPPRRPAGCRRARRSHSGFDALRRNWWHSPERSRGGNPYPVPLDDVLHGMAVFDALVEIGENRRHR